MLNRVRLPKSVGGAKTEMRDVLLGGAFQYNFLLIFTLEPGAILPTCPRVVGALDFVIHPLAWSLVYVRESIRVSSERTTLCLGE